MGRKIAIKPLPKEIIWFLLAKEFGWSPKDIKEMNVKDVQSMIHILSTYNKVMNQKMERAMKNKK